MILSIPLVLVLNDTQVIPCEAATEHRDILKIILVFGLIHCLYPPFQGLCDKVQILSEKYNRKYQIEK